jgi:ectoine hydroxylase-related dioxygenase (phytanoyl-CoA dioxygenase family)
MALSAEQLAFFEDNGYLPYERVLAETEVEALRQRSAAIARNQVEHVPRRYVQLEAAFRQGQGGDTDRLDQVRKMTHLCYFDPLFAAVARQAAIVDVIEELLGPNIKLYCDQLMMKARFNGTVTDWHQDSVAWPQFAPQDHVSCWIALDDATVDNGCMTVLPGSHKWGPIEGEFRQRFLANPLLPEPVPVELKAGSCMFHHGLNFHRTGANSTPHRRRGLALHYMRAETIYLGAKSEAQRLMTECEQPPGQFRFMSIRGKEFADRV